MCILQLFSHHGLSDNAFRAMMWLSCNFFFIMTQLSTISFLFLLFLFFQFASWGALSLLNLEDPKARETGLLRVTTSDPFSWRGYPFSFCFYDGAWNVFVIWHFSFLLWDIVPLSLLLLWMSVTRYSYIQIVFVNGYFLSWYLRLYVTFLLLPTE